MIISTRKRIGFSFATLLGIVMFAVILAYILSENFNITEVGAHLLLYFFVVFLFALALLDSSKRRNKPKS